MPYTSAAAVLAAALSLAPTAAPTATDQARMLWHLDPAAHYELRVRMTHVIANDLSGFYKKLVGSKADPVTIIEDRTTDVATAPDGGVDAAIVDVRHYGGLQSGNTQTMRRTASYKGTIGPDGKRQPSDEPLVDAGEGALAEIPDAPIAPGQTWTFSRDILVDRDLGQGSMTYTNTLQRLEVRDKHTVAVIGVSGLGRVDVAPDLKAKGFQTAQMTLTGTAEFDLTSGLPGIQHYTAHVQWNTRVLWMHVGLLFDDTYDAMPWSLKGR